LEWGCPNQFGNPSGHSWMVVLMYEPLITDFIGSGWCGLTYLFPIVVAVLVPISRMYLGVHAGN
jgi:membrane-associated phospholipid phosphatase